MPHRPSPTSPSLRTRNPAASEWQGGLLTMPAYVTGDEGSYRPEVLVWLAPDGSVAGSEIARPGRLLSVAGGSLQLAIDDTRAKGGTPPTRLKVTSAPLADVLRHSHPGLKIVCGPVPELDGILAQMAADLGADLDLQHTYLGPGIDPEALAAFFRASAALYRAKPWTWTDQELLIAVSSEELGLDGAVLIPIGQVGEDRGLVLYPDMPTLLHAVEALRSGNPEGRGGFAPHQVLGFSKKHQMPSVLREEVAAHGWELASSHAYPGFLTLDKDLISRPPSPRDLLLGEALASAIVALKSEKKAIRSAMGGGTRFERALTVKTSGGEVTLTLRIPYLHSKEQPAASRLMQEFAALSDPGQSDFQTFRVLQRELLEAFAEAPEAKGLELSHADTLLDLAARYLNETIATLDVEGLRKVLFVLYPRQVSVKPSDAPEIVRELQAFYAFLRREHGLQQAGACLGMLDAKAVQKLEAELADPRNFGLAKSVVMGGAEAGFDVGTRQGLEQWMRKVQGTRLPPFIPIPRAPGSPTRAEAKAKKAKRKAARVARRRNR